MNQSKTIVRLFALLFCLLGVTAGIALAAPAHSPEAQAARADIQKTLGFLPRFFDAMGDTVLPGAWAEMKGLQLNQGSALPAKTKELIGLAVAAQVPCKYCIYAHTEFAKLAGASDREIAEAIGMAAITRNMSTLLNGQQTDENAFRADVDKLVANVKAAQKPTAAATAKR